MNLSLLDANVGFLTIKKDIDKNALSHAYIVCSEDERLRKDCFTKIATSILCKNGGCLNCRICSQILSHNHVDVAWYDGKDKITTAIMTDITSNASFLPVQGEKKIIFIDNAELLLPIVQNKLLKTFEEPPISVAIFLGVNNLSGLLRTIKSRAKIINLGLLDSAQIFNELKNDGIDEDTASVATGFAMGNMTKARSFCDNEDYKSSFETAFNVLTTLKNSSEIVNYLSYPAFNKENIGMTFDFFEIILSDVMKLCSHSNAPLFTVGREYDIKKLASTFTPAGVSMSLIALNEGRKRLYSNLSSTAVAEKFLFDMLEAKYKWQ